MYSKSEVLRYVEENDVKFAKLTFCDINGKLKNISVLSQELEDVFENGIKLIARKIQGFSIAKGKDLFLFPDPVTMSVLPWRPQHGRVIRLYGYIRYADGTPFEGDSRYFLKKAQKKALSMGYCFRFGTSSEFTLFRLDECGQPTSIPHDQAGYCDVAPEDRGEDFRRNVCFTLEQLGIHPISSFHESGPGQHEIHFNATSAVKAADTFLSFKSAVKSVAAQHDVHASFTPLPLEDGCGNGMDISVGLLHQEDFLDDKEDTLLADEITNAAAGILKYYPEMMIFTNSTVNSYKRLNGLEKYREIHWSHFDDECVMRVDEYAEHMAHMTLHSSDCECNPYYVFGLLIYAALDGITQKMVLDSPVEKARVLPESLADSIETAKKSAFLHKYLQDVLLDEILSERIAENEERGSL